MANITYRNIILQILIILILICCISCKTKETVVCGNKTISIEEIKDPNWFDYSYFWQHGRDKDGNDLTIVTIYWTKIGDEGTSIYVTDGKKWEEVK